MTQEQINKLQELKKLFDAGIITQEELQAEKAKILNANDNQSTEESPAKDTNEEARKEPDDAITSNENTNGDNKVRNIIMMAAAGILAVIIIIVLMKSNGSTPQTSDVNYQYDPDTVMIDEVSSENYDADHSDEDVSNSSDDEFAFDPWSGSFNIRGSIYRTCSTLAYITLTKDGNGMYEGTMDLMLGDAEYDLDTHEPTGRFYDDQGHLKGQIRAKKDGSMLTIVLDSYSTSKSSEFFNSLSGGQQMFRLTYDGNSYSAQAIGEMESFFDGGISITK